MATDTVINNCGALIYCSSTNRYLFLLRSRGRFPDTWGIVGGKIENNETIQEGLLREIREELGGEIIDAKIIPIEQYTSENSQFIYNTFLIKVEEEFIPVLNHEHKGYCWTPLDHYPKPLHPGLYRSFKFSHIREKIRTLEKV